MALNSPSTRDSLLKLDFTMLNSCILCCTEKNPRSCVANALQKTLFGTQFPTHLQFLILFPWSFGFLWWHFLNSTHFLTTHVPASCITHHVNSTFTHVTFIFQFIKLHSIPCLFYYSAYTFFEYIHLLSFFISAWYYISLTAKDGNFIPQN